MTTTDVKQILGVLAIFGFLYVVGNRSHGGITAGMVM